MRTPLELAARADHHSHVIYLCYYFAANDTCTTRKKLKFDRSHEDESNQPLYEYPPEKYSANRIITILLTATPEKICKHKPTNINRSSTFVVDVRCLKNQEDIKKDEFGIWQYSGSHPQCFLVKQRDDGYIDIQKCEAGAANSHLMYLRRLHCTHPSNSEFKRLICFLSGRYMYSPSCLFCRVPLILKVRDFQQLSTIFTNF